MPSGGELEDCTLKDKDDNQISEIGVFQGHARLKYAGFGEIYLYAVPCL